MGLGRLHSTDIAEDGHPCEAALEFRRVAVRAGLVEEIPADALDLAISFAWLGKAVSRTDAAARWQGVGTDPNTWQIVRAMAASPTARKAVRLAAEEAPAVRGFESELEAVRASTGYRNALHQVATLSAEDRRLSALSRIARKLPGSAAVPAAGEADVLRLDDFRKKS